MALPVISNNSPSAGYISWTDFGIQYDGLSYSIAAGSTDKKYTWWDYQGPHGVLQYNWAPYPRGTTNNSTYFGSSGGGLTTVTDMPGDIPTAVRHTRTQSGTVRIFDIKQGPMRLAGLGTGAVYTIKMRIRSSAADTFTLSSRASTAVSTGAVTVGTVSVNAGEVKDVTFTGATFTTGTVGTGSGWTLTGTSGVTGDTVDITALQIEAGSTTGAYFDGDTADTADIKNVWMSRRGVGGAAKVQIGGLEQRRNLHPNPRQASTVLDDVSIPTQAGGSYTITSQATGGPLAYVPTWKSITFNTVPTASPARINTGASGSGAIPVSPSTQYTLSAYTRASNTAIQTRMDIIWYNSSGTTISTTNGTYSAHASANTWERKSTTATSPASAAYGVVQVSFAATTSSVGDSLGFGAVMLEQGTLRDYLDGETPSTSGIVSMWLGLQYSGPAVSVQVVPSVLTADVLPTLEPDDYLLFINKNGVGVLSPMSPVVDGSLIITGTVFADAIAANQIETYHIKANAVTTTQLAANAVTAQNISAGAITTEKLTIASISDSLVANGSFEDNLQGWAVLQNPAGSIVDVVTGVASSGAQALRITRNGTAGTANDVVVGTAPQFLIPVSPTSTRSWYVSARVGAGSALASGFSLTVFWYQADKTTPSAIKAYTPVIVDQPAGTTWQLYEGQAAPPTDAKYACVAVSNLLSGATMYVDEVIMYEVVVSAMIGDGQIHTPQLAAGAVVADTIAAGSVGTQHLVANSILSNHIAASQINVNHLEPSVGGQLNIEANDAIVLQAGRSDALEAALDSTNESVSALQTTLSVTSEGVAISKIDPVTLVASPYRVLITDSTLELQRNRVAATKLTEAGLEADSFIGQQVILANHKWESYGAGSVIKAV